MSTRPHQFHSGRCVQCFLRAVPGRHNRDVCYLPAVPARHVPAADSAHRGLSAVAARHLCSVGLCTGGSLPGRHLPRERRRRQRRAVHSVPGRHVFVPAGRRFALDMCQLPCWFCVTDGRRQRIVSLHCVRPRHVRTQRIAAVRALPVGHLLQRVQSRLAHPVHQLPARHLRHWARLYRPRRWLCAVPHRHCGPAGGPAVSRRVQRVRRGPRGAAGGHGAVRAVRRQPLCFQCVNVHAMCP